MKFKQSCKENIVSMFIEKYINEQLESLKKIYSNETDGLKQDKKIEELFVKICENLVKSININLMGFLVDCNTYLLEHKGMFSVFLYAVLVTILVIFVVTLVHVYRGTRYYLVIFITASVIADVICYMFYSYYVLTQG